MVSDGLLQTPPPPEFWGSSHPYGPELEALADNEDNWNIGYLVPVSSAAKLEKGLSKVRAKFEKVDIEAPKTVKAILQVACEGMATILGCKKKDEKFTMNKRGLMGLAGKFEEHEGKLR